MLFFPAAKSGTRPPFPCSRLIGPALVLGSLVSLAGCAGGTMVGSGGFTRSATPIAEYETADASASANLASLTDVVQRNPSDAGALNTRGAAYARIGRYQEAIADFNAALKIEPNMATALTNRALANRQIGRTDAALQDFNHAIEANPKHTAAYLGRANLLRTQGSLDQAMSDLTQVIRLNPENPQAFHARGLIRQRQGDQAIPLPLRPIWRVDRA